MARGVSIGAQARVSSVLCEGEVAANSQSDVIVSFKPSGDVTVSFKPSGDVTVKHWCVTTSWDRTSHHSIKGFPFLLLHGADFTRRTRRGSWSPVSAHHVGSTGRSKRRGRVCVRARDSCWYRVRQ